MDKEWFHFTSEERSHLIKAWTVIEPMKQSLGCDIYEMIFNQCPEIRRLFPKMKFHHNKPDRKNNEFAFQALRFVQVIESAITCIESLPKLDSVLENLGRRHGKLEISGKFQSYYWSTFLECSIFNIRKVLVHCRKYDENDVDTSVILFRFLLRDVLRKIKGGCTSDIAHRMNNMSIEEQNRKISIKSFNSDSRSIQDSLDDTL